MLKKLVALFVTSTFLSSLLFTTAHAETPFQAEKFPYQQMQIQVMPEFDYPEGWPKNTPSLLVGIYGTITNKSGHDYSGNIEIPVPTNEKNFVANLVAEFPDVNKSEVQRPYDIDKTRGVISWKPQKPIKNNATYRYVIEYYTNSITGKDQKAFTYQFKSPADIKTLDVIFYEPMNAKNMKLLPKPQSTAKSDYGEALSYYEYKNVKKGNGIKYSFSYQKPNTDSTMSIINKQQPPNDANHSGLKNNSSSKTGSGTTAASRPIIGIGGATIIGIAIIIAGLLVFFGIKGNNRPVPSKGNSSHRPNHKQAKQPASNKGNKLANTEAKKELRKKLLNGKIDQETYEEEMKKLI